MSRPHPPPGAHEEAAIGWVLHTLDRDDEVDFLVHLEDCAQCRRTVAEVSGVTAAMGRAVTAEEPPARLRDSILAAVAEEPDPHRRETGQASADSGAATSGAATAGSATAGSAGSGPVGSGPVGSGGDDDAVVPIRRPRARRRVLGRLAAVAATVALVVVIGGLVAENRSLTEERDAQAAAAQRVTTVLADAGRPGAVHAMLAAPSGAMVGMVVDIGSGPEVLTTALADNRPDHVYVLWSLNGGAPRAVGTFDVSGSTPSVRSVGSVGASGHPAAFAVSLEPGRRAPASPTTVVASGPVGP